MKLRKLFTLYLLILSAIGFIIVWGLMLVDTAQAGDYPPGCPWEYREGWTCQPVYNYDGELIAWVYVQDTPGPTMETYPGVNTEPSPYPTLGPYPGIDDAVPVMEQDNYNLDPTATATRMVIVTRHGRGKP